MSRTTLAQATLFLASTGALAALPACSRTIAASYPGGHVVTYSWRACGMRCDAAFTELEDSHDPMGKACEDLVTSAVGDDTGGGDPRATAAALFDSGLVLVLRGRQPEAAERFARADALDSGEDYAAVAQLAQQTAQQYPVTPLAPPPAAPSPALEVPGADDAAPVPAAAQASPAAKPTSAPSAAPPRASSAPASAPAPAAASPHAAAPPSAAPSPLATPH